MLLGVVNRAKEEIAKGYFVSMPHDNKHNRDFVLAIQHEAATRLSKHRYRRSI